MRTTRSITRGIRLGAVIGSLGLSLALTSCGSDTAPDTASDTSSDTSDSTSSVTDAAEADGLTITDPWVKAVDDGMTAAFGTMVNSGDTDVVVMSATADVSDMVELHETVQNDDGSMAMQPREGGFEVPAGGDHELAPGGDHIMMMGVTRPLEPGETVTLTLTLADGSTTDVEATVKEFTGADENYQDGEDSGMDMDEDSGDN